MNGLTLEQANDRSYGMRMHEGLRVVAVANSPRMMREALERALEGVPGILVVDLGGEPERAEELSRQIQVNWLVVTLEHGASMSRRIRRLLHRVPSLAILALSPDGDRVEMLVERGGQLRRFTSGESASHHSSPYCGIWIPGRRSLTRPSHSWNPWNRKQP